eukprot:345866_1
MAVKQCTLSIITIITTLMAMICVAMFSMEQVFIAVDVNISTLCIVLMYRWNQYLVEKLCCICVKSNAYRRNQAVIVDEAIKMAERQRIIPDKNRSEQDLSDWDDK